MSRHNYADACALCGEDMEGSCPESSYGRHLSQEEHDEAMARATASDSVDDGVVWDNEGDFAIFGEDEL